MECEELDLESDDISIDEYIYEARQVIANIGKQNTAKS